MNGRVGERGPLLVAAAAGCLVAPPLILARVDSPLRVVAALLLFGLAPGAALLPLLATRAASTELMLVLGTSLGISTVVAQLMVTAAVWSPDAAACVLAAACIASIAGQIAFPLWRARSPGWTGG